MRYRPTPKIQSSTSSPRGLATRLGCKETSDLLQQTLDEESATDKLLSKLSEGKLLKAAPIEDESESEEE